MFSLVPLSKSKFFTRVALVLCVFRSCRTLVARVWHSCCKIVYIHFCLTFIKVLLFPLRNSSVKSYFRLGFIYFYVSGSRSFKLDINIQKNCMAISHTFDIYIRFFTLKIYVRSRLDLNLELTNLKCARRFLSDDVFHQKSYVNLKRILL